MGISLLRKRKVVTEMVVASTWNDIKEEQGGFRRNRECVDQISSLRITAKKKNIYIEKNPYFPFIDLCH